MPPRQATPKKVLPSDTSKPLAAIPPHLSPHSRSGPISRPRRPAHHPSPLGKISSTPPKVSSKPLLPTRKSRQSLSGDSSKIIVADVAKTTDSSNKANISCDASEETLGAIKIPSSITIRSPRKAVRKMTSVSTSKETLPKSRVTVKSRVQPLAPATVAIASTANNDSQGDSPCFEDPCDIDDPTEVDTDELLREFSDWKNDMQKFISEFQSTIDEALADFSEQIRLPIFPTCE